jgi:hypothetical protein
MSNSYKIYRWDSFLYNKNISPIIYVKPDDTLLKFAKKNNNALLIRVSKSNSIYDGKKITGVLYKSSDITKCSNFFNKTGLYVIVLESDWYGYPDFLGECDIFGLEGDVVVNENTLLPLPDQNTNSIDSSNSNLKSQKSSLNTNYIWMLVLAICVAIVILMILYKKIKKHKRR